MNYTLNQLQIFQKIVETKSITKAAMELHLTQPAVSIQLKNFQDQFEIPLTEVVGRRIYITDFGYEIAKAAENILTEVEAINIKTLAFKGHSTGRIKISVVSTGKYVMPFFISDFLKLHPSIELLMDVTNKNKVIDALINNEIDFALVSILPTTINIEKLDLLPNKLYLIGNDKINRLNKTKISNLPKDIPFIYREKGSGTRHVMESFLTERGFDIHKKMELTTNEAVKQAVIAGLGYSIMPLIGIKNEIRNGELQIIETKGLPINTKWSLIWLKSKKHSPISLLYLEFLRKEQHRIAKEVFSWCDEFK